MHPRLLLYVYVQFDSETLLIFSSSHRLVFRTTFSRATSQSAGLSQLIGWRYRGFPNSPEPSGKLDGRTRHSLAQFSSSGQPICFFIASHRIADLSSNTTHLVSPCLCVRVHLVSPITPVQVSVVCACGGGTSPTNPHLASPFLIKFPESSPAPSAISPVPVAW